MKKTKSHMPLMLRNTEIAAKIVNIRQSATYRADAVPSSTHSSTSNNSISSRGEASNFMSARHARSQDSPSRQVHRNAGGNFNVSILDGGVRHSTVPNVDQRRPEWSVLRTAAMVYSYRTWRFHHNNNKHHLASTSAHTCAHATFTAQTSTVRRFSTLCWGIKRVIVFIPAAFFIFVFCVHRSWWWFVVAIRSSSLLCFFLRSSLFVLLFFYSPSSDASHLSKLRLKLPLVCY